MGKPIQISIPTPCHEDWQQMTPVEKGRFCASCQKKVFDFTNSSDREIAAAIKKDRDLCGRFLNTQLNRDLAVPKEKNTLWIAASAAIISFLGLGNNEVTAQENPRHNIYDNLPIQDRPGHRGLQVVGIRTIKGVVGDAADSLSLENVTVINKNSLLRTETDSKGNFTIKAVLGDSIEFIEEGYLSKIIVFKGSHLDIIMLDKYQAPQCTIGSAVQCIKIESRGNVPTNRGYWSIWDLFR